MNLKYTALALLLLNSAFSFSAVNSKAPQQSQTQQVTLSPEEQEMLQQMVAIANAVGSYMDKYGLSIVICGEFVFQLNGNQVSLRDPSEFSSSDLAHIPNITDAFFAEITAEINAMASN